MEIDNIQKDIFQSRLSFRLQQIENSAQKVKKSHARVFQIKSDAPEFRSSNLDPEPKIRCLTIILQQVL